MGLILETKRGEFFGVKHSFDTDERTEPLVLMAGKQPIKNKSEFVNRCILSVGEKVLREIAAERKEATAKMLSALSAATGKISSKPPGKLAG